MTNLTNTQRLLLSHASMRPDGSLLPLPRSTKLNAGSVGVVLKSLINRAFVHERPAARDDIAWRETEAGERVALAISDAGFEAIGVVPTGEPHDALRIDPNNALTVSGETAVSVPADPPAHKSGSKLDTLLAAISSTEGATLAELMSLTNWQAHSVRGAIAGALKKRNIDVVSAKEEPRGRVYRLRPPQIAVPDAVPVDAQ